MLKIEKKMETDGWEVVGGKFSINGRYTGDVKPSMLMQEIREFMLKDYEFPVYDWVADIGLELRTVRSYDVDREKATIHYCSPAAATIIRNIIAAGPLFKRGESAKAKIEEIAISYRSLYLDNKNPYIFFAENIGNNEWPAFLRQNLPAREWLSGFHESRRPMDDLVPDSIAVEDEKVEYLRPIADDWDWLKESFVKALVGEETAYNWRVGGRATS